METKQWSDETMMIRHTGEKLDPEIGRKFVDHLKQLGQNPQFKVNNNDNHPIFGILLRFAAKQTGQKMTPREACDWIGFKRCDPMFPSAGKGIGNYEFRPMHYYAAFEGNINRIAELIEADYLN